MELRHVAEPGTPLPLTPELESLYAWARANGVLSPKVRYPVQFANGLHGTQAVEYIGPDEDIVRVPLDLLLSCNNADNTPLQPFFRDFPGLFESNSNSDTYKFIAFLLREAQNPNSFWKPFLDTVPRDIETVSDWTASELFELQDSVLAQDAKEDHSSQQKMWMRLKKALDTRSDLFPRESLSFREFRRWYGVITTRCFGRFKPSAIMAPVADFLNHGWANTYYDIAKEEELTRYCPGDTDYDDTPGGVDLRVRFQEIGELMGFHHSVISLLKPEVERLKAFRAKELEDEKWDGPFDIKHTPDTFFRIRTGVAESYEAGAQVFLFYGNYSNRQLLTSFGFAIREDRFSYYSWLVPLAELIADGEVSRRLERSIYSKVCQFKLRRKEVSLDVIRTVRCLLWTPASAIGAFSRPLDWDLELRVALRAKYLLTSELGKFPTTLTEDYALLETELPIRLRFAVLYRVNLKESLSAHISALSDLADALSYLCAGEDPASVVQRARAAGQTALEPYLAELVSSA